MKQVFYSLLLLAGLSILSSAGCNRNGGLLGLSAARKLEGTWRTVTTTPMFYYYSDVCGSYIKVAKQQIGMQWNITHTSDNTVDIEVYRTSSSSVQLLVSSGCALYVPLATPIFLTGEISSSQLTLKDSGLRVVGSFSITTDNLNGDFNSTFEKFCGAYCSGASTDSKTVTLVKQ